MKISQNGDIQRRGTVNAYGSIFGWHRPDTSRSTKRLAQGHLHCKHYPSIIEATHQEQGLPENRQATRAQKLLPCISRLVHRVLRMCGKSAGKAQQDALTRTTTYTGSRAGHRALKQNTGVGTNHNLSTQASRQPPLVS
eukprot:802129-Pelagomonas_calceolata.AAC.1